MATTMKKTATPKTKSVKVEANAAIDAEVENVVNDAESVKEQKVKIAKEVKEEKVKEPRKFESTDAIACESITSGELGMTGIKSHISYKWAERNDVTEVEYQDLVAAIRSGSAYITKPYFLIRDDDFLAQFPQVINAYESLYSIRDLKDVLRLNADEMKATIEQLPTGAKQSIKNIAATMIQNGTLDSVNKIKILDELFDTKLMLITDLYN